MPVRLGGGAFADNVSEFLFLDVFKAFTSAIEGFEGFDQCFRHAAMGFIGSAHNCKALGTRNPLMAVLIVEANAEEVSLLVGGIVHGNCSLDAKTAVLFLGSFAADVGKRLILLNPDFP